MVPAISGVPEEPSELMYHGEIKVEGQMPWSSNATLLVHLEQPASKPKESALSIKAIYKPLRGERPLWDFPPGLYLREVAAFELSRYLGWNLVPATIIRSDGPYGVGSLQRFVDANFSKHYFHLLEDENTHLQLQLMCAFDLLINNTDRKAGHCLIDNNNHIWGIDNGLAFHEDFKLRTVIWDFGDKPLPEIALRDINHLVDNGLPAQLLPLLSEPERDAILFRAQTLLEQGVFPTDPSGRRYPWPLI